MRIFLVRHGVAENKRLSEFGRAQIRESALKLKGMELSGVVLCSSPELRAVESAEIIKEEFGLEKFEQCGWLGAWVSGLDVAGGLVRASEACNPTGALIAVSHMPQIEDLASALGCREPADNGSIFEIDPEGEWAKRL